MHSIVSNAEFQFQLISLVILFHCDLVPLKFIFFKQLASENAYWHILFIDAGKVTCSKVFFPALKECSVSFAIPSSNTRSVTVPSGVPPIKPIIIICWNYF